MFRMKQPLEVATVAEKADPECSHTAVSPNWKEQEMTASTRGTMSHPGRGPTCDHTVTSWVISCASNRTCYKAKVLAMPTMEQSKEWVGPILRPSISTMPVTAGPSNPSQMVTVCSVSTMAEPAASPDQTDQRRVHRKLNCTHDQDQHSLPGSWCKTTDNNNIHHQMKKSSWWNNTSYCPKLLHHNTIKVTAHTKGQSFQCLHQ